MVLPTITDKFYLCSKMQDNNPQKWGGGNVLTLAKVDDAVILVPEFVGELWARLSSWQSLSRSSDRLIGRTRGGGPKCHFCC